MNTFAWLDESFSLRLAATLLHFLWQGLAVALIVLVTGWLLKRVSAQVRYSINVAAMLVMVACLPVTFALVDVSEPVAESDGTRTPMTLQLYDSNRLADDAMTMPDGTGGLVAETDLALSPTRDANPPMLEARTADTKASPGKIVVPTPSETKPALSWLHPAAPYLTVIYFAGVLLMLLRLAKALCGGRPHWSRIRTCLR